MLIVISPAKSLDFESPLATKKYSQPKFLKHSQELIDEIKTLAPHDIASLMKLSDKLADLNYQRFQDFTTPFKLANARQAILAFQGDVYQGLEAESFSDDEFEFAQENLRILSGLYGLLRPLDLMQPYRLEMGTKFENGRGKNLYDFWDELLVKELQKTLDKQSNPFLVNLASNEYFKAAKAKKLSHKIVTPVFKDCKNGEYKVISFFAKRARGMMSRYIIQNKITKQDDLKGFDVAGYKFDKKSSSESEYHFKRKEQ